METTTMTMESSVPAFVGSPQMTVIAAIPTRTDPREYIVTVERIHYPNATYGTVRTYRDADGTWQAWAGHYDLSRDAAISLMIHRAGWGAS
jgi:hypothetical protein